MRLGRLSIFSIGNNVKSNGSILIIVLWIAFGLVSIALYFANSMSMELRASENRAASAEAEQAIEGAARYVSVVLSNSLAQGGTSNLIAYQAESVQVGNATFWLIGRDTNDVAVGPTQMTFGLVDEGSKLNLNSATSDMLEKLPNMTQPVAAAIKDWRDADDNVTTNGAESLAYSLLQPAYTCKNTNFESVDELRLVAGMNLNLLYGEDSNLNGILDANEDDGETLPPMDNHDGRLDAGLLDYVTVYTHEPTTTSNGTARVSVASATAVQRLLTSTFTGKSFRQIAAVSSVLQFYVQYVKNQKLLSADQFAQVESSLRNTNTIGLVNVNKASLAVLTCIPGISTNNANLLINYRNANPTQINTIGWVAEALSSDQAGALRAGPYITTHSYQYSADVAAVGQHGRGYRRVKFVFDTSSGTPRIIYRQDLTHLGWALGRETRNQLLLAKDVR